QALRVVGVVHAIAAFHAQPASIGTAVAAAGVEKASLLVGHIGDGAADAAVWTQGVYFVDRWRPLHGRMGKPFHSSPPAHSRRQCCSALWVSAPVGQTAAHSPQATQLLLPMGTSRSKAMRARYPLPLRVMTWLCCNSLQPRMQRSQRMQAW